jgi:hypothetical protein
MTAEHWLALQEQRAALAVVPRGPQSPNAVRAARLAARAAAASRRDAALP